MAATVARKLFVAAAGIVLLPVTAILALMTLYTLMGGSVLLAVSTFSLMATWYLLERFARGRIGDLITAWPIVWLLAISGPAIAAGFEVYGWLLIQPAEYRHWRYVNGIDYLSLTLCTVPILVGIAALAFQGRRANKSLERARDG